jgi:hypothetical protein
VKYAFIVALLPLVALADESPATVVIHPLEFKLAPVDFNEKQVNELQSDLRRLSRKNGLALVDTPKEDAHTDCVKNDNSLADMAKAAKVLHVVYANLNLSIQGDVTALVRVVRDDGKLYKSAAEVTLPLKQEKFIEVARLALDMAFTKLDLASLPSGRPVEVVKPIEFPPSPLKPIGFILAGVGAAAAVTGVVVFVTAPGFGKYTSMTVPNDKALEAQMTQSQETIAVAIGATGVGLAAIGAILILAAPSDPVQSVSVIPLNQGAAVSVSGRF